MAEYTHESSVKANIDEFIKLANNSAKANILATDSDSFNQSTASILVITSQDSSTKANISYLNLLNNNSVKANIVASHNNFVKGNIIFATTNNNSVKASLSQGIHDSSVVANIQLANAIVPLTVKNLNLGFSKQPGILYTKDPDIDEETISAGYVTARGIMLQLSDTGSYSNTIANGDTDTIIATFENDDGKRLFAIAAVTLYEGSVAAGNEIPEGVNVTPTDWEFTMWTDWGDSDNFNTVHKTHVRNVSGVSKDIVYRINFKFIVEEASF